MTTRLAIGCMTGTSMDALDAALVEIQGHGLDMRARVMATASCPLGPLTDTFRHLARDEPMSASRIAAAARDLACLHVDLLRSLLDHRTPDLVAVHGQTIWHAPPISWQLIAPWPIAHALRAPVVFDLRAADLAAGGQGAPITPLADWVLFRPAAPAAVVNLGGFCNVTFLPGDARCNDPAALTSIAGGDVCPCNHLLDAVARNALNAPFDVGGGHALTGRVHAEALTDLHHTLRAIVPRHPDLPGQPPARSLGSGDEADTLAWIQRWKLRLTGPDLAATACAGVGDVIAATVRSRGNVFLAGGGTRNAALVHRIATAADSPVALTDTLGVPAAYREAVAMAILGALCQDRVPLTLPQITGVPSPAPVAGTWILP